MVSIGHDIQVVALNSKVAHLNVTLPKVPWKNRTHINPVQFIATVLDGAIHVCNAHLIPPFTTYCFKYESKEARNGWNYLI